MTRDTVWCETPASRATSEITAALRRPSRVERDRGSVAVTAGLAGAGCSRSQCEYGTAAHKDQSAGCWLSTERPLQLARRGRQRAQQRPRLADPGADLGVADLHRQ